MTGLSFQLPFKRLQALMQRVPPGWCILILVMCCLRGPQGAAVKVWQQLNELATSFVGAEGGLGIVVLHTLPLAGAAAIIVFLFSRKILLLDTLASVAIAAGIILAGAAVGGAAPGWLGKRTQPEEFRLEEGLVEKAGEPLTAWEKLQQIDWLAEPHVDSVPSHIRPLDVLPTGNNLLGWIAHAINQLLGYLVVYQPRLFIASVLSGGWMGYVLHTRLGRGTRRSTRIADGFAADVQEGMASLERPEQRNAA